MVRAVERPGSEGAVLGEGAREGRQLFTQEDRRDHGAGAVSEVDSAALDAFVFGRPRLLVSSYRQKIVDVRDMLENVPVPVPVPEQARISRPLQE